MTFSPVRAVKPVIDRWFPQIARAYRTMRDSRFLAEEPVDTPMGFKFLGEREMQSGHFEPEEAEVFRRLLRDAGVFVNVGANAGLYCCHALMQGRHTVAFEPIALNVQYLCRNVLANGWQDNIEIHPLALSNSTGIARIFGGGSGASFVPGWGGIPEHQAAFVPTTTMDLALQGRFKDARLLILIDVEGAEFKVLDGAAHTLVREPRPIWMVEIMAHRPGTDLVNPALAETFARFRDSGYIALTADRQLRPVGNDEIRLMAEGGWSASGTHNFVFVECGLGIGS